MQWLINISIKYKIMLVSLLGIIGFVIYFAFNYFVTVENSARLERIKSVYFPALEKTDANIVNLDKIKEILNTAVGSAELDLVDEADAIAASTKNNFRQIAELSSELNAPARRLDKLFADYYKAVKYLTKGMIEESLAGDEINPAVERMNKSLQVFDEEIKSFREENYRQFTRNIDDANLDSLQALMLGLIMGLVTIGVLTLTGYIIISMIAGNLANVISTLEEMASGQGDLTKRLQSNSSDEIGDLVNWFNTFVDKLHNIIRDVSISTETIATGSKELVRGNNDLSNRTVEQSASLEETSATMEEMTSSVKQNAESANQTNLLANSAREQAAKGSEIATEAVAAMREINKSSDQISEIIGVIDDIAFQTNLLALNAAVEAARAGDQGRGFAVVATEVRNLAQRSASAAKEIKTLITDSAGKVKVGSDLVDESGQALEQIKEAVKQVLDYAAEIAAAGKEQADGIDQVNSAVVSLDQITQQNAALVEEATSASRLMEEQAENLMDLMSFFKVDGGASGTVIEMQQARRPVEREHLPANEQSYANQGRLRK